MCESIARRRHCNCQTAMISRPGVDQQQREAFAGHLVIQTGALTVAGAYECTSVLNERKPGVWRRECTLPAGKRAADDRSGRLGNSGVCACFDQRAASVQGDKQVGPEWLLDIDLHRSTHSPSGSVSTSIDRAGPENDVTH